MTDIETIREAWRRYHAIATNQPGARDPLMSIPVNRERDADCILNDAIDELATLRARVAAAVALCEEIQGANARAVTTHSIGAETTGIRAEVARRIRAKLEGR